MPGDLSNHGRYHFHFPPRLCSSPLIDSAKPLAIQQLLRLVFVHTFSADQEVYLGVVQTRRAKGDTRDRSGHFGRVQLTGRKAMIGGGLQPPYDRFSQAVALNRYTELLPAFKPGRILGCDERGTGLDRGEGEFYPLGRGIMERASWRYPLWLSAFPYGSNAFRPGIKRGFKTGSKI